MVQGLLPEFFFLPAMGGSDKCRRLSLPRFSPRGWFSAFFCFFISLGLAQPAHAQFTMCNKTSQRIEAAFGFKRDGEWSSLGWWGLLPAQCVRMQDKPLQERYYYYYARTTYAHTTAKDKPPLFWNGQYLFCVKEEPFDISGSEQCETKNAQAIGFSEIDVGDIKDYVLDIKEK